MNIKPLLDAWSPRLLSVLRIVVALLYIEHGTSKFFGVPQSMGTIRLFSLMGAAGVLEIGGSILLFFGLFTRPVAFILSGQMAFAYFLAHAPHSPYPLVNHGEAAVFYCFVFLYFAAAGGGAWSLDKIIRHRE
ncbi:MAG TPA: DoxX family protein [Gammaproteobacteria bacterium]|nr:DoxX family protein [Gammaproteobacteria bacterium]